MRPTILLFDIDGTLISSGGAGRRAVERAFRTTHATRPMDDACRFSFAGMTDRAIARRGLLAVGAPIDDAAIDAVLEAYLGYLAEEVAAAQDYRVHAGMHAALDAAAARGPSVAIGLGTGNVVGGARVKLDRVGLFERFAFGGFGSDHEDRAELLRIGAERGAGRLGIARSDARVVVIGDTPKDVAAARAIGAEVIAVATGPFDRAALSACAPDWTFADLDSPAALAALLDGKSSTPR